MTINTINDAVTMQSGAAGTLLAGRYRVVRQLGQGGMGSVWLAEDTQLDDKQFAIKMLPSILVSNKRAYRQLKDEALVAMQLVHPNIVQIRAFEENNGNPFLVMDYVDGETLDDYLAEHCGDVLTQSRRDAEGGSRVEHVERVEGEVDSGRDARPARPSGGLPEEEVFRLLKPIAAALDYAHSKGVVHRDVKPGNVMIAKEGTPYILDFGIAREIQETMTRVTGKLSSGTLLYMSPEQLNGEPPKSAQDVYSFAAMVYECLKGEPPFVRGAIEDQIKSKEPPPLAGASVSLASSIMAGLAKKPEYRPATCAAVLEGNVSRRAAEARSKSDTGFDRQEGMARTTSAPSQAEASGRKEPKGRKGVGKAIVVFALLAALGGGGYIAWIEHEEAVRCAAEHARIVAEQKAEAERKVRAEAIRLQQEEERRAQDAARKKAQEEQLARQKKEEEERRAKAEALRLEEEKKSRERELARQMEEARKAAATEIRIEAAVHKSKVERISDGDGFKSRKDELAELFARADALFDEKVGRWGEAAQRFTNFVNRCNALVKLDDERQSASMNRKQAHDAFKSAEADDAKTYARDNWNAAVAKWKNAVDAFGRMDFATAARDFEVASQWFARAGSESRKNKKLAVQESGDKRERGTQLVETSKSSNSLADNKDFVTQIRKIVSASPLVKNSGATLFLPSHPKFNSKWINFCEEVRAFGVSHRKEDAYALLDTTVFGAGDTGILIDKLGITVRSMMSTGDGDGFITWDDFGRKGIVDTSFGRVTLCETPLIRLNGVDFLSMGKIDTLMNKLLDTARNSIRKRGG